MKRLFLILSVAIIAAIVHDGSAANFVKPILNDSAAVRFRQGDANLDTAFCGNGKRLDAIINKIQTADSDSLISLRSITVTGAASPEGPLSLNHTLSEERANAIFNYISAYDYLPANAVSFTFLGRDWEGLRTLVEADPKVPDRPEVLRLLDRIIATATPTTEGDTEAIQQLHTLNGGIPYSYLYTNLYPSLRESQIVLRYAFSPIFPLSSPKILAYVTDQNIKGLPSILPPCSCRPFHMSLKTNLLYDALALPTIGAEFYLGKNISLAANWMYGWWDRNRTHFYWRAYGGDITMRWWFGKQAHDKPLTGHHLGIYGGVVTYDFELGGTGYMGGLPNHTLWDRCNRFAGIEYGYSLPVARRLNIDFTIGIGYLGGRYMKYAPLGKHYVWQSTHDLTWFGPTKAEVSLVWLIGCGNYNPKKGGK